jgi:cytochrome c553
MRKKLMNNKLLAFIITLVLASISGYSAAAELNQNPCADIAGNSFAGRVLCNTGNTSITPCASCHGNDGNSTVPSFPKLAGQNARYLAAQLLAFKNGDRSDASMQGIAQAMNEANMDEIASFYERLNVSANTLPELDEDDEDELTAPMDELLEIGSNLYIHGSKVNEVPACAACHGVKGAGNNPAGYPALASQHATYLIKSLNDFKAGLRSKDPENVMHMISQNMSEQEIEAVSYYLSVMK